VDYSPQSSAEDKNECRQTSIPSYGFTALIGTTLLFDTVGFTERQELNV
jgi:hypothetical protein